MQLKVTTVVALLALFFHYIEGFERVRVVKESDDHDDVISSCIPAISSGSGGCYSSLHSALTNLTSNVLINITSDVVLCTVIPLVEFANITIIGYNNPTVNCNNSGGLHFMSCDNCTIKGITWDECGGSYNNTISPVLQLSNSSNIMIKSCTFQHSLGQAVTLAQMTGDVNINNCNFSSNKQYEGHGTGVHYLSNDMLTDIRIKFTFTIKNSNFYCNEKAESVVYFGHVSAKSCEYLNIQNCKFHNNRGVPIYLSSQNLHINGSVEFDKNIAGNGAGIFISDHSNVTFHKNATVKFVHNRANHNGGAIYLTNHSSVVYQCHDEKLYGDQCPGLLITVIFYNNTAGGFGQDIYADNSNITFGSTATLTFNGNYDQLSEYLYNLTSASVYAEHHSTIKFQENTIVTFNDYYVNSNGGVMYINQDSTVIFEGNSTVTFIDNKAFDNNGGIMYINQDSTVTFKGSSNVTFTDNSAFIGGVIYINEDSTITFKGDATVTFTANTAYSDGGVMYIGEYCTVTSKGNSTVTFTDNEALGGNGGVIYINGRVQYANGQPIATVTFGGNSTVTFTDNSANSNGGVIFINDHGSTTITKEYFTTITFEKDCTVTFIKNEAAMGNGGVMYTNQNSTVTFEENANVTFAKNSADSNGGVMYIGEQSTIIFERNSTVTFTENKAHSNGGVMYLIFQSTVMFRGNSTVLFAESTAYVNGGVFYIGENSTITFQGNSTVTFTNSAAYINGGVLYIGEYSTVTFEANSKVIFTLSEAYTGAVMHINQVGSTITFEGTSEVSFTENSALMGDGGVMYINGRTTWLIDYQPIAKVTFAGNSAVIFTENGAHINGGVMYIGEQSAITFKGNSAVTFTDNYAESNGGVMYVDDQSIITFQGNSNVTFTDNDADSQGGVMFTNHYSHVFFEENSQVMFHSNRADLGGSIYNIHSSFIFNGNSSVKFDNNTAYRDGGAIYLSDMSRFRQSNYSTISFYNNRASDYGGAVYALINHGTTINFNSFQVHFKDNTSGVILNSIYIDVLELCDSTCLYDGVNISNTPEHFPLVTSPNKLVLYSPAKCINSNCDTYYMTNIMLGQEVTLNACVFDYYDQSIETAEFLITGMKHQDYNISGSKYISVSCNHTTQGINIIGNLHSNDLYNYSVNISLYVNRISESKVISVKLIVELSLCHPGFWYSEESHKCECYDNKNIISCSGSNSTIKRGYWFGSVTGNPTVAFCPNDYCNFTCCEITNGIYHLSPVRANQCRPNRSGTACGECDHDKGYTLSFDSPECVEVNKCTIGLVLVTTISLLYWIVAVVTVFAMMYFKISIGSLYGIVYYYSVVDILLSQVMFMSNGLYTTVSIISSLAKLTPQFLGRLCLVRNMSGIDQQFIHYIHPVVVLLILIMLSVLARRSRRVSSFISRGIIHFICLLLLLSYTSITTTSLLLLRPLTFMNIDAVYTYLSPDFQYFHDRHLVYGIVAILFTIMIVVGFPLLLVLEPFLNAKINFVKIKPLLDQFQGCYKDKYRCFAGYYMICRLVIILLVIIKISDDFTTQYLLISSCALMQLIHLLVRPYASTFYNVFDGIILQLIVIISVLRMVELVDDDNEIFIVIITDLLIILPLTSFVAIRLWINKKGIQDGIEFLRQKCSCHWEYNQIPTDDPEEPTDENELVNVIDDRSRRRNTTMVAVNNNQSSEERLPDIMWCRDPFMEQLNEIEALDDIRN